MMTDDYDRFCKFAIDIYAPNGLSMIGPVLKHCRLPLYTWESGYNGKTILRDRGGDDFEWEMDSSNECCLFASGGMLERPKATQAKLQSLSDCLAMAGYPHQILIDDPEGDMFATIRFEWNDSYIVE